MFETCGICGEEFYVRTGTYIPSIIHNGEVISVCSADDPMNDDMDED